MAATELPAADVRSSTGLAADVRSAPGLAADLPADRAAPADLDHHGAFGDPDHDAATQHQADDDLAERDAVANRDRLAVHSITGTDHGIAQPDDGVTDSDHGIAHPDHGVADPQ